MTIDEAEYRARTTACLLGACGNDDQDDTMDVETVLQVMSSALASVVSHLPAEARGEVMARFVIAVELRCGGEHPQSRVLQ